ncbi:unnamed protein product [Camellia sinensis]
MVPPSTKKNKALFHGEKKTNSNVQLPPGFRFHPTDRKLIVYYLRNKATASSLPAAIIAEVYLYKCNPWELPRKALFGEVERYFFTPRDKKYPNGVRPNRMAASGYWKATGTDKPIRSSCGARIIGVKKAPVFYRGRPPRGIKMDWNMQEYRLAKAMMLTSKRKGCIRLDDWVLCRVRQKNSIRNSLEDQFGYRNEPLCEEPCYTSTNAKLEMAKEFLYRDCLVLPLIIGSSMETVSSISFEASKTSTSVREGYSDTNYSQYLVPLFNSSINGHKRKQPTEGTQNKNFIQPKKKVTDRDDQWSDNRIASNLCITNQSEGNNFNTNQWNSIIQYQEFNHLDFAEAL